MELSEDKFINEKEELKLMKCIEPFVQAGNKQAIVDKFLFQCLALTGLRISEALALTWKHVGEDYIMVLAEDSKSGKKRSVFVGKRFIKALEEFKLANPYPDSPYLFNTQKGQYGRTTAHTKLKYWIKVAGLRDNISCHSFRHSYATRALEAGIPLQMIRTQMGHSHIGITSVYLHFTANNKEKVKLLF